ncbi:MAG: PCRF domain-containing protein, partial [Lachnospiraceae bacterium]|nr:PCRF domain-containing protein [Lachnospiraceae bacterium]
MIIALEEARLELIDFRDRLKDLGSALRIDYLREQAQQLEEKSSSAEFWNDTDKSTQALQVLKQMKDKIARYDDLCQRLEDTIVMAELANEENDESMVEEILADVRDIKMEEDKQRISILLNGQYDRNNAIVSFHPGAGGTEAQDWAQMLYRMY